MECQKVQIFLIIYTNPDEDMFIKDVQCNAKKKRAKNLYEMIQCSRCNVVNVELLGVVVDVELSNIGF